MYLTLLDKKVKEIRIIPKANARFFESKYIYETECIQRNHNTNNALALDLGKYNIRVNAVLPGMIKTDRWESNYNDCRSALSNYTPLGDIADFEDIANAVWYFGSDNSKNTTGAELTVDGGNMIQLYPIVSEK